MSQTGTSPSHLPFLVQKTHTILLHPFFTFVALEFITFSHPSQFPGLLLQLGQLFLAILNLHL